MSYKLVLATAIAAALSGVVQAQQPATTTDVATARAAVLTAIPSNATTVTNYYKQNVYDPSESKIGEIVDVLVSNRGTIDAFIVSVGGFLGIDFEGRRRSIQRRPRHREERQMVADDERYKGRHQGGAGLQV